MFCAPVIAQNNDVLKKLNFNAPELKSVKYFYNIGDNEKALRALLNLYRAKENLYLRILKDDDVLDIKSKFPEDVQRSIKTADEVLKKYFIFRDEWDMEKTNIPYQFKGEIDWTAIPNGDIEWCFMLNRHKYWIDIGQAYMFTGNEKYAKGFVNQVNHWIDNNPFDDNLKKYSWRRIEAGIRCENWIKAFEYVKNSKHITPQFLTKFLNALYQHAIYINEAFSNFSKTSNWGVIEFQGLLNVSQFLTEFKEADQWAVNAIQNLNTCINIQILEDGTQWEQSPLYHNEVLHCFMNVNLLAQRNHIDLPESLVEKTKQMALANIQWQKPNYNEPLLGDSDDNDLRGMLTLAAMLFDSPVLKSRAYNTLDYELLILMGKEQAEAYEHMDSQLPDFLSIYQHVSGDFYMRDSWAENAVYSSIHLKKIGGGHGHDNLLHITLYANGKDYLVDGGRYTYIDNEWREFFKNNKSHNTLGVDDLTNSVYQDSWSNSFDARSQGVYTKIDNGLDYAEAENTAYKRLEDPVSMKRRLLYIKPNIWLMFDSFLANKKHRYSQYFNFPNDSLKIENKGITTSYKVDNLRIQPVNKAEITLTNSWWSPEYNLKKENKRAEIFKEVEGFSSFITLMYFPDKTDLKYEKTPVYNRNNKLLSDTDVEALNIYVDDVIYTILVVNNPQFIGAPFIVVNNLIVAGEVVLIENRNGKNKIKIIKG
ncbi:hypothetical protein APS56_13705 [Pseudalgibacter alginicilyticus]|uniref:Uncharacterized protein n=2 Tax=Pseudalgibacter alginicilyticus TaxID=1736674 RepID=A0A0P0CIU5_9FLAO|nr:hypothetical protein APS56_13705 [Pseudalgibacter alginicilyticus]